MISSVLLHGLRHVLPAGLCVALGCHHEPARRLIVDEALAFCAVPPHGQTLELVQATQWMLEIPAGEVELPDAVPLPAGDRPGLAGSVVDLSLELRGAPPAAAMDMRATVIEHANLHFMADADHDVLQLSQDVPAPPVVEAPWSLSLSLMSTAGGDFTFGTATDVAAVDERTMWMGCVPDAPAGTCPNRIFETCDPGGPITRTRVTLDRGEVVLDVRTITPSDANGPARLAFVAGEIRIDGVAVVQREHADLLLAPIDSDASAASYAVLAPSALEPAGLGCAVVLLDLGTPTPHAATADCQLQELAPLTIAAVTRELVP